MQWAWANEAIRRASAGIYIGRSLQSFGGGEAGVGMTPPRLRLVGTGTDDVDVVVIAMAAMETANG